jgi:hypothetical protein
MIASALTALRLLGHIALLAGGTLALMVALVDLPDMAVPKSVQSEAAQPIEANARHETAQCLEYTGL